MYFFDEDPKSLPSDAQYYFNICVITIGIRRQYAEQYLGKGIDDIVYTDQITDPRPKVYYFYIDDDLDNEDCDVEYWVEYYPHCVIEISPSLGVSWWEMIDFDTEGIWRIEP